MIGAAHGWASRDRGAVFDNAACAQCGRAIYMVRVPADLAHVARTDVKCDGCGEPAPWGCWCPELPRDRVLA